MLSRSMEISGRGSLGSARPGRSQESRVTAATSNTPPGNGLASLMRTPHRLHCEPIPPGRRRPLSYLPCRIWACQLTDRTEYDGQHPEGRAPHSIDEADIPRNQDREDKAKVGAA